MGSSSSRVYRHSQNGSPFPRHSSPQPPSRSWHRLRPVRVSPTERQLLNVVEEMAIASGTATPPVYLLEDEDGINAFAAGYALEDAVIGVTRGTAERLSRDELQGVVAHEFSHILNGDMRLNLRLIALLHGIMVVALIGQFIFRVVAYSGIS